MISSVKHFWRKAMKVNGNVGLVLHHETMLEPSDWDLDQFLRAQEQTCRTKTERKTIVHKISRCWKSSSFCSGFVLWLAQFLAVFPLSAFLKIFLLNCFYQFANVSFGEEKSIMYMKHMSREWIVSLIQGAKGHGVCILKSLLLHFSHPLDRSSCHHVCEH